MPEDLEVDRCASRTVLLDYGALTVWVEGNRIRARVAGVDGTETTLNASAFDAVRMGAALLWASRTARPGRLRRSVRGERGRWRRPKT